MEFSLDTGNAAYRIEAYGTNTVTVSGQLFDKPIVVMPEHLLAPWGPADFESLSSEHFEKLLPFKPQVVLLGTGNLLRFPNPLLFVSLKEANIGVEIMSTPAACRTYSVLMSEGRQVAAALFNCSI
jgi:uncharacterized protein